MSHYDSRPLPSRRQLLKATAIAIAVAGLVLVTTVLPAEYGIDPTGLGARLGLTHLHLAETPAGEVPAALPQTASVPSPVAAEPTAAVTRNTAQVRRESLSLILAPGQGAEIKARMQAGDGFVFHWTATGGEVAVDMHGERVNAPKDEYTSYWIEPAQASASGVFTAPFEGTHGWYWHNRNAGPVTLQVEVSGFQGELYRP